MKTRLYGLLALMLCAMMVVMPAVAMGATSKLIYDTALLDEVYNESRSQYVSEEDIILTDDVKLASYSGNPLTIQIIYDTSFAPNMTAIPDQTVSINEQTKTFSLASLKGRTGWRVKSIEDNATDGKTVMHVELVGSLYGYGNFGNNSWAFVYNNIFTPKTTYGGHSTKAAIEAALKAKVASLGDGYKPYLREIDGYSYIDSAKDSILRNYNPVGRIDLFDRELRGKNGSGWLIHMKNDGSFEKQEITVDNGTYKANLTSYSPYAIAFKEGSTGGNGGSGVIAPSGSIAAPSSPNLPQTGDNSQLLLWSALALLSLTGAVLSIRRKKA